MRRLWVRSIVAAVVTMLGTAAVVAPVASADEGTPPAPPAPTITSDQQDYAPGSDVTLTGAGWDPAETVDLLVNDDAGATWRRSVSVTADVAGTVIDSFTLPDWFVASYSVTATGGSGRVATTTFTDGAVSLRATNGSNRLAVQVSWTTYTTSTSCSSGLDKTGNATTTTTGPNAGIPGESNDAGESVKVIAPSSIVAGGITYDFHDWNGVLNPTACFAGSTGTQNLSASYVAVNIPPTATDDGISATEDTQRTVSTSSLLANDSNGGDGGTLTLVSVSNAVNGTVGTAGGDVQFTPALNVCAPATGSFDYVVSDGTDTDTGSVSVTITCVNDAPGAVDDDRSGTEDTPLSIASTSILANDTDVDSATLTLTAVSGAVGGSAVVDGSDVDFTPTPNLCGNDVASFGYTVSDGSLTDTGNVTIDLTCVNDGPIAVDDARSGTEDTDVVVTQASLLVNDTDADGPSLTLTGVSNPTGGTVQLDGDDVEFAPSTDLCGTDVASYDYTVSDGTDTDTGEVTISLTCVNDAPVAGDDTVTATEDTPLTIAQSTLLGNDTDVDSATLTVFSVSSPSGGSVAIVDGDVVFTPDGDLCGVGAGSFSYTATDASLNDIGVVTVDITCVNDAPVAADDHPSGTEDTVLTVAKATLLANDTDVDGPSKTLTGVTNASGGSVEIDGDDVKFTPTANLCGLDSASFDYTVSDGVLADTGTVTIDLLCVNDVPELTLGAASLSAQYSDKVSVSASATDVDDAGSALAFSTSTSTCGSATTLPAGLAIVDAHDGTATLEGAIAAPAGSYTVCIVVTDASNGEDSATVAITVTKEAATVGFADANPAALQVSSPGGSLAANELSVTIKVEETEPDAPSSTTTAPGDIVNADLSVVLNPVAGGSPITLSCTPTVTDTGYASVRAFVCTNAGALAVAAYEVVATVTGSYYVGSGVDSFTVFDPSLGFATGGGKIVLDGDKITFGFVMKYGKNGSNLKGSFVAVRHFADGTVARLKSNSLGSMALTTGAGCGTTSFDGKATYMTWDSSSSSYLTTGNTAFKAWASDCNEPGTGTDSLWTGGPPMFSMPTPTSSNAKTLIGGNIAVPHSAPK
jgi:large repetitive protein